MDTDNQDGVDNVDAELQITGSRRYEFFTFLYLCSSDCDISTPAETKLVEVGKLLAATVSAILNPHNPFSMMGGLLLTFEDPE